LGAADTLSGLEYYGGPVSLQDMYIAIQALLKSKHKRLATPQRRL
jgi:hypothetical protein